MKLLIAGLETQATRGVASAAQAAGHQLQRAASVDELKAAFAAPGAPDGAIVAAAPGDPEAAGTLASLRKALGKRPAWLMAWVEKEHDAWAALAAGADDVMVGPMDNTAFALRLGVGQRNLERQRVALRLRYLAKHPQLRDPQTGAMRPGVLVLQLEHALARMPRSGRPLAVIAIEAEAVGLPPEADLSPLVLGRVLPCLRKGDSVAVAEDRTVLALLEDCTPEAAEAIAAEIAARVRRMPESAGGVTFTCSVGLSVQTPGQAPRNANALLDEAGCDLAQGLMARAPKATVVRGTPCERPSSRG